MQNEKDLSEEIRNEREESKKREERNSPETAEHPVPGIKHEHEPDAENIMPVEDGPGTF